jgi:AcrR family transcriptional regulator
VSPQPEVGTGTGTEAGTETGAGAGAGTEAGTETGAGAGAGAEGPAEAILEAAARCFARWGVPRTRVEDIAGEAGIARPNVYRYYPSKDAIVLAVVVSQIRHHHRRLAQRHPLTGPVADIVVPALVSGIVESGKDFYAAGLVRPESANATARHLATAPEVREEVAEYWEPVLSYAGSRGELRPGLEIADAVRWITFVQFGYLAIPELVPEPDQLERDLRGFVVPALLR